MITNRKNKIALLMSIDFVLIFLGYILAIYFRVQENTKFSLDMIYNNVVSIVIAATIYLIIFGVFKLYRSLWSLAGIDEVISGILATIIGCGINLLIGLILPNRLSNFVTLLAGIMILILCNGVRISWRFLRRYYINLNIESKGDFKNVLIIGAGRAGSIVQREYKSNPELKQRVVGFVDDDKQKLGTYIGGIKVLGSRHDIKELVKKKEVDEIIIAIGSLPLDSKKQLINICKESKVKVKIMPSIYEILESGFNVDKIRDVDVKDLLGRDEVKLDHSGIAKYIEGKTVLVTGGGGSIGSELCRQIVRFFPERLIILDIYENNAYDIQNELLRNYPYLKLTTLIASVRDRKRLNDIYTQYKPDVVFHAAAHKHVPLMEESPMEAIKNNVVGTLNCAELASEHGVDKFVLISTDKAVNPTNVMGATKRLCEMIVQALNKESKTEFVAVRFGNVLGSNGSVIPLFKKQIAEGGPLTLTHRDITRYFMLIPEAAQLVLQAGAYASGGEIFVLDMGSPVKIYDLACDLIKLSGLELDKDIKIQVTGLRPGEKLYEELLMNEEGLIETKHEKIFIGIPGVFDLEVLKTDIEVLLGVAKSNDKEALRNKLSEVVPTYVREKNMEEVAATE